METELYDKTEEAIFCGCLETTLLMSAAAVGSGESRSDATVGTGPNVQMPDLFGSQFCQGYTDREVNGCDRKCCCLGRGDPLCSQEDSFIYWGETDEKHHGTPKNPHEDLCATIDTGCQRMAVGLNTLHKPDKHLPSGLYTRLVRQEHRSVHGTSTTNYAAVIPTSLGTQGSLLRPAIFDSPESCDAPFLIPLPFLMCCKAVLNLDPSKGLSMEPKRFGYTVKCHLGPSGALRVPLGQFDETMLQNSFRMFSTNSKHRKRSSRL